MKKLIFLTLFLYGNQVWSNDTLPSSITYNQSDLNLCNQFTLRYGYIIKVADIGWYATVCKAGLNVLETNTKILRFHYHKDVSAQLFKDSAKEFFNKNLDSDTEQIQLSVALDQFNTAYADIKSGDYYDLIHWNGQYIKLNKNNQMLGISKNPILAKYYFNIWFGNQPVIEKLKNAFNTTE